LIIYFKVNALLNEVTLKENQRIEIDQFIEQISNDIKSIPQGKIRHVNHTFLFVS
jgi:hypothetical protein